MHNTDKKFKILLFGLLFPMFVYFFITIFVINIFKNSFENPIVMTGISSFFTIFVLIPVYQYTIKERNEILKPLDISIVKYLIPLSISLCLFQNIIISFFDLKSNEVSNNIFELNIFVGILISSVMIPIVEEIIFRGFVYKSIECAFNTKIGIILSSLIFAFFHFNLSQGIYAFFTGIILSILYYKYKNILYPIILHALMNLSSYLIFYDIDIKYMKIKTKIFILTISLILLCMTVFRLYNIYQNKNENQ